MGIEEKKVKIAVGDEEMDAVTGGNENVYTGPVETGGPEFMCYCGVWQHDFLEKFKASLENKEGEVECPSFGRNRLAESVNCLGCIHIMGKLAH